jgi:hypothetical protein
MRRILALSALLLLTIGGSKASAWGCDGHRAIAMIAEQLLSPETRAALRATLNASPVDPGLVRSCMPVLSDVIADASTWADDYRDVDTRTFGWHFINVPRSAVFTPAIATKYCKAGNCAPEAIMAQYSVLTKSADPVLKANALRFLLHLVGDLHQPLHAITNGDRGGNCVPVTYHDQAPHPTSNGDYSPNLHGVWDTNTIRTLMDARGLSDSRALAAYVAGTQPLPTSIAPLPADRARVTAWAREAHQLGSVWYEKMPVKVANEPATAATVTSCEDNHGVVHRMLAKHEVIDATYEQASIPVIVSQLRLAGARLAGVLKASYP